MIILLSPFQIAEAACRRGECEKILWAHFEEAIAPEVRRYQVVDPDDNCQLQVSTDNVHTKYLS